MGFEGATDRAIHGTAISEQCPAPRTDGATALYGLRGSKAASARAPPQQVSALR